MEEQGRKGKRGWLGFCYSNGEELFKGEKLFKIDNNYWYLGRAFWLPSFPHLPHQRHALRFLHLQRNSKEARFICHLQQSLPSLQRALTRQRHRPDPVLVEQHRYHGDKFHLSEFSPETGPWSLGPGDESAFGRFNEGCGFRVRVARVVVVGGCEPAFRAPFKSVGTPDRWISVEGFGVDGDPCLGREQILFILDGEGLCI